MSDEAAVGFELGHAHVAAGADRRYALAGTENEDIAVEDVFFRDDGHSRQDRVVTAIQSGKGVAYLVHLHFQAGQVLLVDIAHADRTDDVLAGQEQADEHGRAHIAQGDDMDAGLPGQLRCPVEGHGRGSDFSGQIMYPFIQVLHLLPVNVFPSNTPLIASFRIIVRHFSKNSGLSPPSLPPQSAKARAPCSRGRFSSISPRVQG